VKPYKNFTQASHNPVGKIAKKTVWRSENTVPCCQKCTPTDCFLPTG